MENISNDDGHFSITFSTYNGYYKESSGIRHIKKACLQKKSKQTIISNGKHKLLLYDYDQARTITIWIPLIMFFNDQKIEL